MVLDEGPVRDGMRAAEVRKVAGREGRVEYVITRSEPPERYDFRTTSGPVQVAGIIRCADEDGATRVSYNYPLRGVLGPLIAMNLRKACKRNLAKLKDVLESAPDKGRARRARGRRAGQLSVARRGSKESVQRSVKL